MSSTSTKTELKISAIILILVFTIIGVPTTNIYLKLFNKVGYYEKQINILEREVAKSKMTIKVLSDLVQDNKNDYSINKIRANNMIIQTIQKKISDKYIFIQEYSGKLKSIKNKNPNINLEMD